MYAWNKTHPISRKLWEEEEMRRMEAQKSAEHAANEDIVVDAYAESMRDAGKWVHFGPAAKVLN